MKLQVEELQMPCTHGFFSAMPPCSFFLGGGRGSEALSDESATPFSEAAVGMDCLLFQGLSSMVSPPGECMVVRLPPHPIHSSCP